MCTQKKTSKKPTTKKTCPWISPGLVVTHLSYFLRLSIVPENYFSIRVWVLERSVSMRLFFWTRRTCLWWVGAYIRVIWINWIFTQQTMDIVIRRCALWSLFWVCTVCTRKIKMTLGLCVTLVLTKIVFLNQSECSGSRRGWRVSEYPLDYSM